MKIQVPINFFSGDRAFRDTQTDGRHFLKNICFTESPLSETYKSVKKLTLKTIIRRYSTYNW